mgnify:CR=1 FL=1
MLVIIADIIYGKKYAMKRNGNYFLISKGLTKFLIHKKIFKYVVEERNIHNILVIIKSNKELIIYRT